MIRATVKIEPTQIADRYQVLLAVKSVIDTYLAGREHHGPVFAEGGRRISKIRDLTVESPGISHLGDSLDLVVQGPKTERVRRVVNMLMQPGTEYPIKIIVDGPYLVGS
ncbi:hypothetical protein HYY71_05595 [Candidatus Woesearchaeota archaeon]|nr:hypothetical protein [Candidatus Woesearchaeota archaeon]